jgi:hypothetical protein
LPDAKKCGDEFWGESFHYLAQRTQRAQRQSIISHRGHRGRGGILLSRTEDAEGAEVTPPCDSATYRILHGSPVETVPSGQVVLIHCVL